MRNLKEEFVHENDDFQIMEAKLSYNIRLLNNMKISNINKIIKKLNFQIKKNTNIDAKKRKIQDYLEENILFRLPIKKQVSPLRYPGGKTRACSKLLGLSVASFLGWA